MLRRMVSVTPTLQQLSLALNLVTGLLLSSITSSNRVPESVTILDFTLVVETVYAIIQHSA